MAKRRYRATLRSETFDWIEAELRDYPETKKRLGQLVADIAERGMGISYEGETHRREASPEWSDPTSTRGTALLMDRLLSRMRSTVSAIESALEQLPDDQQRLVRLFYFRGANHVAVCDQLAISRYTLWRWRNVVVLAVAKRLGAW